MSVKIEPLSNPPQRPLNPPLIIFSIIPAFHFVVLEKAQKGSLNKSLDGDMTADYLAIDNRVSNIHKFQFYLDWDWRGRGHEPAAACPLAARRRPLFCRAYTALLCNVTGTCLRRTLTGRLKFRVRAATFPIRPVRFSRTNKASSSRSISTGAREKEPRSCTCQENCIFRAIQRFQYQYRVKLQLNHFSVSLCLKQA